MKNIYTVISFSVLSLCLFLFCSCGTDNASDGISTETEPVERISETVYQKITAEEAKEMMDENSPYILLDVRTETEYEENHIDGAVLIPDYEINERAEAELYDKGILILVYCRSGRRSAEAAAVLIELGYTNVYDFGGIIDWTYGTTGG